MTEPPAWLTTADAEEQYGFPARTFAAWCLNGKIAGARKEGGEWLMPAEGIAAFLNANPQLKPAERNIAIQVPGWLWHTLNVVGLIADVYAIRDVIRGGDRTLLWTIAGILSAGLFVSALFVLLSRRRHLARWDGEKPIFTQVSRFRSRRWRVPAKAVVVLIPVLLILFIVGYNVWRVIPPRQTVVLVADFLTPEGQDPNDVTEKLVKGMRDTLTGHPNIKVKRLNQRITEEEGSDLARGIGSRPEHKAAFVIWGDYVLTPEPEMYVHFDILRQTETYLGSGDYEQYGPAQIQQYSRGQIQQPDLFDFKLQLGLHLGQLTAFASGLALFDAGSHKEAIPLFDTAAQAIDQPLAAKWERVIRFYRGTNFLVLGRALDAKPDLAALVPDKDQSMQVVDGIALLALGNLGVVARYQGDYAEAKTYHEQALAIAQQLGNSQEEANQLGNLGVLAGSQGDYATAKTDLEQALAIVRQLNDRQGEAASLTNLGLVAFHQGDNAAAKVYFGQALAIVRQLSNPGDEAMVLANLGLVALRQGDYKTAKAYHEQALAIAWQLDNPRSQATALGNLGLVAFRQGDYAVAKASLEQALAIERQLDNPLGESTTLGNLGLVARHQGDYAAAKAYQEQALAIAQQLGNPPAEATALGNLGVVASEQGNYAGAKAYLEQALAINRQLGNRMDEATSLINLGSVAFHQGDKAAAKAWLEQALAIARQLGNPLDEATVLGNLGLLAGSQGNYAAAEACLEQALALHQQLGNSLGEATALGGLGLLANDQGNYFAAKTYLEQALTIDRQLGVPVDEANHLGILGWVAYKQEDHATAKIYLEQSIQIYQRIGVPVPSAVQSTLDSLSTP